MIIETLRLGSYGANCYIVGSEKSKDVMIIDPGAESSKVKKLISSKSYNPIFILLTHGHGDHIGGAKDLKKEFNIPVYIHKKDSAMLKDERLNFTNMMFKNGVSLNADKFLEDGDKINLDNMKFQVIHTPGHTPGGICLKNKDVVFSGDTLFKGSIGRTDLPGGSYDQIIKSIKEKLLVLDEDTVVYPGHEGQTTIKYEKENNPFLK
ncbi:MAG: MBL fold metallo-hydrolase [Bacillota bacterium]|nr:MBL fold metallo-hydrolase [Bacillota bacterium]